MPNMRDGCIEYRRGEISTLPLGARLNNIGTLDWHWALFIDPK